MSGQQGSPRMTIDINPDGYLLVQLAVIAGRPDQVVIIIGVELAA